MSTNKYITDTRFAGIFDMERQFRIVVDYLIANRTVIANTQDLANIFSTRATLSTPMTDMFSRCMSTGYINEFATILKVNDNIGIPDILTMNSVVTDLKQSKYGKPLQAYPELYQKIIMNVSNLVRTTNTGYYVTAIQELHSMYVKAMLTRSYAMSQDGTWLSPAHQQFVIRSYSLLVATVIARNTGLDFNELLTVATIFALYMSQMLSVTGRNDVPNSFYNLNYLGQRSDLVRFVEENQEDIENGLTLDKCCELVAKTGPARLKKYNTDLFYRQCVTLGSYIDTLTTRIAMEYPPYWVWFIVHAQSGAKLGSFMKIMQQHGLVNGAKKFVSELIHSQAIYESR